MQSENRLLDDVAKLMNGLAGTAAGIGREAQEQVRERMRGLVQGGDMISRDEFEAVKAMAAAARDDADALRAELNAMRARLDALDGKAVPASDAVLGGDLS
jgi:BMFP domain-containing protein YqiC